MQRGLHQGECAAAGHRSDSSFRLVVLVVVTIDAYDRVTVVVVVDSVASDHLARCDRLLRLHFTKFST